MGNLFSYLVPLNLGLFAAVFSFIYLYEKRLRYTGFLALAYFSGTIAALLDVLTPHSELAKLDSSDVSYIFYWTCGIGFAVAMSMRYLRPLPVRLIAATSFAGVAGQLLFGYFWYVHALQEALANGLLALYLGIAAHIVRRSVTRRIDKIIWMMFVGVGMSCLLRVAGIYIPGVMMGVDSASLAELHNVAQLFLSGISANAAALALLTLAALDIVSIYRAEATVDPMTGLLNRRGLERELQAITSGGQDLNGYALILIDLDNFKMVNDRFGHHVGDVVLHRIGALLNEQADQGCLLARLGGEEFVAVVPAADHNIDGDAMAVRIWHNIRTLPMADLHDGGRQTASIGIAIFGAEEDFRDVYPRADKAMYAAKHSGRDAIVRDPVISAEAGDQAGDQASKVSAAQHDQISRQIAA
jgi:diguanylate cyclase (GGDEF)-like protein